MRFLADVEQFNLLCLFTTNRGLRSACAFQRKAWRFLNIFAQSMTIEGDNQRQRIGMDELDAVFVVNILLPEGRQVHFNRVEIVTPFVGIVGCDAVAGNGARHAQNGVALGVQVERYGGGAGAGRARRKPGSVQRVEILLNGAAFLWRKLARVCPGKRVQKGQPITAMYAAPEYPHRNRRAGQHSSEKNQNGAHAFPILLIFLQVLSVAPFVQ